VVAFQIAFRAEIHANDFFYFLKIIFDISTSKRSKKYKPHSILAKKKISKFDETQLQTQCQTVFYFLFSVSCENYRLVVVVDNISIPVFIILFF